MSSVFLPAPGRLQPSEKETIQSATGAPRPIKSVRLSRTAAASKGYVSFDGATQQPFPELKTRCTPCPLSQSMKAPSYILGPGDRVRQSYHAAINCFALYEIPGSTSPNWHLQLCKSENTKDRSPLYGVGMCCFSRGTIGVAPHARARYPQCRNRAAKHAPNPDPAAARVAGPQPDASITWKNRPATHLFNLLLTSPTENQIKKLQNQNKRLKSPHSRFGSFSSPLQIFNCFYSLPERHAASTSTTDGGSPPASKRLGLYGRPHTPDHFPLNVLPRIGRLTVQLLRAGAS